MNPIDFLRVQAVQSFSTSFLIPMALRLFITRMLHNRIRIFKKKIEEKEIGDKKFTRFFDIKWKQWRWIFSTSISAATGLFTNANFIKIKIRNCLEDPYCERIAVAVNIPVSA